MKMNKRKADSDTQNRKKRKLEEKVTTAGIDNLPDDMLVAILSRMSLRDAMRTSVLSSRWRDLWKFTSRTLEFDDRAKTKKKRHEDEDEDFIDSVDRVLKLTRTDTRVDSLIIRFSGESIFKYQSIPNWIYFAMLKGVKRFELDLSGSHYDRKFPNLFFWLARNFPTEKWTCGKSVFKFRTVTGCLRNLGAFVSLTSLRLVDVDIDDETLHYFLASCRCMEQLCIRGSNLTKNIRVVDDPLVLSLKELEISECSKLQSLVISSANLVSCTYQGREISLPFQKVPKLSELIIDGMLCESFIYQPNKHSSYSSQLVKLVLNLQPSSVERTIVPRDLPRLYSLKKLELNIVSQVGRSLLFFVSLIKASPQLHEFKIKIDYLVGLRSAFESMVRGIMPFPQVTLMEESGSEHKNLKVVEMEGYCGSQSEEEFLVELSKIAPSLGTVAINTDCDYYRDHPEEDCIAIYRVRPDGLKPTAEDTKRPILAKKHADKLRSLFPSQTKFVVT